MSAIADTSAILVCAGNATRMQGKNKILLPLGDTTVIGMAMRAFEQCERVAGTDRGGTSGGSMPFGKRRKRLGSQSCTLLWRAVRPDRRA
ncbi:MAG: hypothetical protein ACLT2C_06005 [Ruminococcus sp.]